jgi:hypothetical protein
MKRQPKWRPHRNVVRCPGCGELGDLVVYAKTRSASVNHDADFCGIYWRITKSCGFAAGSPEAEELIAEARS